MTDLIKQLREHQQGMTHGLVLHGCEIEFDINNVDDRIFGAAADALERMQWNPDMDAAPKDGTPLFLSDGVATTTGEWDKTFQNWWSTDIYAKFAATHWQLLPTPPEGEQHD